VAAGGLAILRAPIRDAGLGCRFRSLRNRATAAGKKSYGDRKGKGQANNRTEIGSRGMIYDSSKRP